jgi:tetratricopeptide (TPR) repeat protein
MATLGKLLGGSASKLTPKIKNAARLLEQDKLKEARALFDSLRAEIKPELPEEEKHAYRDLRRVLFAALLKSGDVDGALALAEESLIDDQANSPQLADRLIDAKALDERSLRFVLAASQSGKDSKSLLLKHSKNLLAAKGDSLSEAEIDFLTTTAKGFPLWKEGMTLLSDRYLREGRKDADALAVYRNAYPNRKADKRLREVLLESLIANGDKDEFAASVYHDAVETSDNPEALCLLSQYYVANGDLTISTAPYVLRALEKTKLPEDTLKKLAELAVATKLEGMDRHSMLMHIYRQGYTERGLLAELSNTLAESGKFDAMSIEIMTRAFEQRVVNKRAILILAEHCLANDRDDDFAVRVYETYLSTWPDRPQRRIYSILAHQFAGLTKVDDQAQKIYQEALVDDPTDPVVVNILARAYHAADRRDEEAEHLYRQAFPISTGEVKLLLARILAEIHVAASDFSQETLLYLTTLGRPDSGPLAARYDEALTNCFLNSPSSRRPSAAPTSTRGWWNCSPS